MKVGPSVDGAVEEGLRGPDNRQSDYQEAHITRQTRREYRCQGREVLQLKQHTDKPKRRSIARRVYWSLMILDEGDT